MTQTKHPFSLFFKPIGSQCNLDCRYCYYWNKHDVQAKRRCIDADTLEAAISQHLSAQPEHDRPIDFIWHGGEPLLAGLEFYQAVVDVKNKCLSSDRYKRSILNTVQSNGSLITRHCAGMNQPILDTDCLS